MGQSTMEMTFESAQFDADLFALATNTEFKSEATEIWGSATVTAEADEQDDYEFDSEVDLTGAKFYVNGFEVATGEAGDGSSAASYEEVTPEQGDDPKTLGWYEKVDDEYVATTDTTVNSNKTYYIAVSSEGTSTEAQTATTDPEGVDTVAGMDVGASVFNASTGTYKTRVTLADPTGLKKGDAVEINYCYTANVDTIKVDNQQTFVGEAILRWPVYSSGEEIKAAGVKGYAMMHIYKCRCTAMPGFDTSYKSAVTNGITLSAMDPHRIDGAIYSISFIEKGV